MANTKPQKQPNVFDTRVIARNLGDGTLSADELKAHLTGLPDVASKGQTFDTTLRGFEPDEDDDGEEG